MAGGGDREASFEQRLLEVKAYSEEQVKGVAFSQEWNFPPQLLYCYEKVKVNQESWFILCK
ncbi:MAG: hypothetical protein ACYCQJ_12475 [Nitrososphaerales archaeon]